MQVAILALPLSSMLKWRLCRPLAEWLALVPNGSFRLRRLHNGSLEGVGLHLAPAHSVSLIHHDSSQNLRRYPLDWKIAFELGFYPKHAIRVICHSIVPWTPFSKTHTCMTHASCLDINLHGSVLRMKSQRPWEDEMLRSRAIRVCPTATGSWERGSGACPDRAFSSSSEILCFC